MQQMSNEQYKAKAVSSFQWLYPLLIALFVATLIKLATSKYMAFEWKNTYDWGLYFCCYFLALFLFNKFYKNNANHSKTAHPSYYWPMPGIQGKLGIALKSIAFVFSNLLSLFNPFLLVQQLRLTFGMIWVSSRIKGQEDEIRNYQTKASYRLPFSEQWLIYHGGDTPETSHAWNVLNQRYAYDFVVSDSSYKRHNSTGFRLRDYKCYDKEILSAADGKVVKVINGVKESSFVGWFFINPLSTQAAGNHIIIKHEAGEYGFYAHLIKGSIPLKIGDKVKVGQLIGRCGFSGSTTEPHLHFHLQDTPSFYSSVGLPLRFENVAIDGVKFDKSVIQRGSVVNNVIENVST